MPSLPDRPVCGGCDWYIPEGKTGRGECGFAPPVAGVVGAVEAMGAGCMDGMMQAATLRPVVRAATPCCVRHPKAAAWQAACRTAEARS